MNWSFIGLLLAVVLLLYALFRRTHKGGLSLGRIAPLKRKIIQFATPKRQELIALSLFFFFFFIADLAQNKFLDLGMDYQVIFFWNITAPAILLWEVFLILFHCALVWLFVLSIESKATNKVYDLGVGVLSLFGVAILLAGVINQIYATNIYFLGMTLRSIDFYHLGVYIEIFSGFYWAFTK
jgi:hypothetical protein